MTLLKQQDDLRARRRKELAVLIAKIPVPDTVLKEITWLSPSDRAAVLRNHPGLVIDRKLQSLWSMLSVFNKTYVDLLIPLDRFHSFSLTEEMRLPIGRSQVEAIELGVNKELVAFSAAAGALVAFSRRLREVIDIPEFSTKREMIFDKEEHSFVVALRNIISHQEFPDINWQISRGAEYETNFVMSAEGLSLHAELPPDARAFVDRFDKGIRVRALVGSYASRVEAFYDWYRSALEASAPEELVDYRRVLKACMANASRTAYHLFLQKFVENGIDPYDHLHKYLLPLQIEEALKLPKHSKAQVDFIIACLDDYEACDDELRALAYRLFNVPE